MPKIKKTTHTTPKKSTAPIDDHIIAEELRRASGNVAHTARMLGLDRASLSSRIHRTPELKQVVEDARQTIVDAAENALLAAVIDKQGWAVCFTLKTIGRDRGYVERVEQQHSGQVAVMSINYADLTDDQLERIANGEHPATVIASTSGR